MRILVVEDEVKVAAFVRQALEEEGHAVDVAHDGEAGLKLACLSEYDLLVLDWLLPGRDGPAVCRALREAGNRLPILMLTARDAVEDRIVGLDAGADDYLVKPFALGELLARARALLRRGGPALPTLRAGDLTLDPATRHVRRGGREIILSAKEYALLEYLMRHAGNTVTRSLIMEHVWDFDFDSGTNVVDVYINYLRNKVDRGHGVKLIHTVRGVGYRLDEHGE
ncbi:MAG: response regulator transcription factor [Armatimonadetes bacterium]|nr:response regulator transcription factor [Armatimonadota bacterium]